MEAAIGSDVSLSFVSGRRLGFKRPQLRTYAAAGVLSAMAPGLALGLNSNVPLMACRDAVEVLFAELQKGFWTISPPAPCTLPRGNRNRRGYGENTVPAL